ncbi:MAG: hypothetical protein WBE68_01540, partial [Candidatus Nitrosopolaris sp.]
IGVPISISILNQRAMNIWIDPTKTNNHFGNAPGTIRLLYTINKELHPDPHLICEPAAGFSAAAALPGAQV